MIQISHKRTKLRYTVALAEPVANSVLKGRLILSAVYKIEATSDSPLPIALAESVFEGKSYQHLHPSLHFLSDLDGQLLPWKERWATTRGEKVRLHHRACLEMKAGIRTNLLGKYDGVSNKLGNNDRPSQLPSQERLDFLPWILDFGRRDGGPLGKNIEKQKVT
ncbi:hypothetical protein BJX70DRAFT_290954 [Aspergillus crustosus]